MSEADDFDEFFRREVKLLVAFVRKAGFELDQAKDAAQEAMIKLYRRWGAVEQPRAYVRTVAYRVAMAEAARGKTGVRRAVAGGWMFSAHHDPDAAVLGEEHEQLPRVLDTLPPRQRLVMAWHIDGFKYAEISAQLGIPESTVRSNARHARTALAKRVAGLAKEAGER